MTSADRLLGQLAATIRHHPDDIAAANDLRREHDLARLHEHVDRVADRHRLTPAQLDRLAERVRTARPADLTDDQRESLALLLRPDGPG